VRKKKPVAAAWGIAVVELIRTRERGADCLLEVVKKTKRMAHRREVFHG
jgi:hypothetical protein